MANQDIIEAFNDCIARFQRGQSIEECLRRYPQYAAALRPMLEAGALVQRAAIASGETQAALERGRGRIRDTARISAVRHPPLMQPLALVASLMLVFAVALLAAGASAQGSLPGDPLYGLKRLGESIQLGLVADAAPLREAFAARRIDEIRQLLLSGRAESVAFSGEVEAQFQTTWLIAGLSTSVLPNVPGAADAQVGDRVEVQAFTTRERQLIALDITVLEDRIQPLPTATASPVSTRSATATASPSPTPSATASMTSSASATASPSASPSLTATPTVSSTPSLTLRPPTVAAPPTSAPAPAATSPSGGGSGGSDNDNTNENDNDNDNTNENDNENGGERDNSGSGGSGNGNDNDGSDDDD